jgi:hypothetical protein
MTHDDVASDAGVCLCGECDAGTERIDRGQEQANADRLLLDLGSPEMRDWLMQWRELPSSGLPEAPRGQLSFAW